MELRFTPQDSLVEKITFQFQRPGETTVYTYNHIDIVPNEVNHVRINFNELFEVTDDHAIYPISLKNIKFTLSTKAESKEYRIPIDGIYLHYNGIAGEITSLENILEQQSTHKILHNGQLIIINNNKTYNILGHEITEKY
jgi:hypothetical protein